ncbi:hypothetical protein H4582DRAFT_2058709 [Lactarius indigo]|nr:hypothetical protein H4582DRAFT_2058709 [Lactarius indigo]
MARRMRQSMRGSQRNQALLEGATGENTSTQANAIGGQGVDNQTQPQGVLNGNGKRTFPHDNPNIPATSEVQPSPPKRARDGDKGKGPADSHPMQLRLTNEDAQAEPEREPERAPEGEGSGGGKGERPALRRTTSFYPGYYGLSSISQLTTDTLDTPVDPSADDPQSRRMSPSVVWIVRRREGCHAQRCGGWVTWIVAGVVTAAACDSVAAEWRGAYLGKYCAGNVTVREVEVEAVRQWEVQAEVDLVAAEGEERSATALGWSKSTSMSTAGGGVGHFLVFISESGSLVWFTLLDEMGDAEPALVLAGGCGVSCKKRSSRRMAVVLKLDDVCSWCSPSTLAETPSMGDITSRTGRTGTGEEDSEIPGVAEMVTMSKCNWLVAAKPAIGEDEGNVEDEASQPALHSPSFTITFRPGPTPTMTGQRQEQEWPVHCNNCIILL